MNTINFSTAASAEIVKALENLGYDQSLAEKIVSHVESTDYEVLLDACGRLKAYIEVAPSEIPRIYHLLHSQTTRNNYGAFRQLGFTTVPDALLKVCRYISVTLKPYLPKQPENQVEPKEAVSEPCLSTSDEVLSVAAEKNISNPEISAKENTNNVEQQQSAEVCDDNAYVEMLEFIYDKLSDKTKKKLMRRLIDELTG